MHDTSNFRAALRRRILTGLGLVAVVPGGCVGEADPSGTVGAATGATASSTGDDAPTTGTPTTGVPTTGDATGPGASTTDDGATTDGSTTAPAGSEGTGPTGSFTTDTGDPPGTSSTGGTTDAADDTTTAAVDMTDVERCFLPVDGACPDLMKAAEVYFCTDQLEPVLAWISGPIAVGDKCCYQVDVDFPGGNCIPGRPFVVDGRVRLAPVRVGARGWDARARGGRRGAAHRVRGSAAPDLAGLDAPTRARLGDAWARDAAFEHASVASFGKLALDLLAFGAPAALLRDVHAAALDEVRHAELTFALASHYLGAPVGPAALVEAAAFSGSRSLAELAAAAVREGCVGETLAAAVAAAQHEAATDPAVRSLLAVVAADEGGHAGLAYRIVAWALASGDAAVRRSVQDAFHGALQAVRGEAADVDEPPVAGMRAHGRFTRAEEIAERRRAVDEVIVPAMTRLLGLPN